MKTLLYVFTFLATIIVPVFVLVYFQTWLAGIIAIILLGLGIAAIIKILDNI